MTKKKSPDKEADWRAKIQRSVREKMEKWDRMLKGDDDALWEIMHERGMCTKEDLDDYFRNKGRNDDE